MSPLVHDCTMSRNKSPLGTGSAQAVVLVDARLINLLYGSSENLDKYLETMSDSLLSQKRGHHTMFSSDTNSSYWRLIRKGTAPAFITKNIRSAQPRPCGDETNHWGGGSPCGCRRVCKTPFLSMTGLQRSSFMPAIRRVICNAMYLQIWRRSVLIAA